MLKELVYASMVFFISQCEGVRDNEQVGNIKIHRNKRMLDSLFKDNPRAHPPWYFWPPIPTIWLNNLPKSDDCTLISLKKKIVALEKSHKEMIELLKQLTAASNAPCDNKVIVVDNNEQPQMVKDETTNQEESDITDNKERETGGNTKDDLAQSVSATINGDNAALFTPASNVDREKVDEKKETQGPPKNDDAQANASLNENEGNEMAEGASEAQGLTWSPEKLGNTGAPEELAKPHFQHSMENNEQSGGHGNDTTESTAQAVYQTDEKNSTEAKNHSKTSENEDDGVFGSIMGVVDT